MINTAAQYRFIGVFALFLAFTGCCGSNAKMVSKELKLKVSAVSQLGIGYGMIYSCDVRSVEEGVFSDKKINLLLTHSNYYESMDQKGMSPGTRTFTFKQSGKNKKDNYPAVSGFIADNHIVWEVVEMK